MGEERKVYRVLVGKLEGKRPLIRPRSRWEDGIRMYLGRLAEGGVRMVSIGSGICTVNTHGQMVTNINRTNKVTN
jgi:hypothetical protein